MARPYWSGQISLSLVSFAVEVYPASTSARPFQFHQIDRATGERIHYQNVVHDGDDQEEHEQHAVEKSEIVKGYEYEKGKYAIIEPDDLKRLRIAGKDTLEIAQFSPAVICLLHSSPNRISWFPGRGRKRRPSPSCARLWSTAVWWASGRSLSPVGSIW